MQLIGAGESGTEITMLSEMYKLASIPRSLPVAMNHVDSFHPLQQCLSQVFKNANNQTRQVSQSIHNFRLLNRGLQTLQANSFSTC